MKHERLWTLRNKLRATEGRGVGEWDRLHCALNHINSKSNVMKINMHVYVFMVMIKRSLVFCVQSKAIYLSMFTKTQ